MWMKLTSLTMKNIDETFEYLNIFLEYIKKQNKLKTLLNLITFVVKLDIMVL